MFPRVRSLLRTGMNEAEALAILGPPQLAIASGSALNPYEAELLRSISSRVGKREFDVAYCYEIDLYQSGFLEDVPPQWFVVAGSNGVISYVFSKADVLAIYGH